MHVEVWQIILGFFGLPIVTAAGTVWLKDRSQKRKDSAEAGKSELDLKRMEVEINQIQDDYSRRAAKAAFDQLNSINEEFRKFREEAREREKYLSDELAKVTTQLIEMTREKVVTEAKYKTSRCDNWSCLKRIPPTV